MKFVVSWRWSKKKTDTPDEVLQKVLLHPKGVMPWSKRSISIFHKRSQEDIVYLDATGSILKRSENSEGPFYVYELVVRNPKKGSLLFPVATYVTCDHTTASVQYFLSVFHYWSCQTIWTKTKHQSTHGHMWWLPGSNAGYNNSFLQNNPPGLAPKLL